MNNDALACPNFLFHYFVLGKSAEPSRTAKLTHGDSLDDVEGFPEDHVTDYVHKLPHIAEIG